MHRNERNAWKGGTRKARPELIVETLGRARRSRRRKQALSVEGQAPLQFPVTISLDSPADPQAWQCVSDPTRERQPENKGWCERGDSNPHPLRDQILSLDRPTDSEADQQLNSANSEQVGQNPQPRRNPDSRSNPSSDPEREKYGGA